jgi:hypothetical protein
MAGTLLGTRHSASCGICYIIPKVSTSFAAFSGMDVRTQCDPTMSAIRYAIAVIPEQFSIVEHKMCSSPENSSLHRWLDVMTEFDPTFEILLALHCLAIGQFTLRKATKEVVDMVTTGVRRMIYSTMSSQAGFEHLRDVQLRNGGIDFLSTGLTPERVVDELPGLVRDRFAAMAEAVMR